MTANSRSLLRDAGFALALGLIFAWFGVYESSRLPFPERLAYWTTTIATGILSGRVVMPFVFEQRLSHLHLALKVLIAATAISVPVMVVLLVIERFVFDLVTHPTEWPVSFGYVLVVSLVLTFGFAMLDIFEKTNATQNASGPDARPPAITERLPVRLRTARIYAVSAEDHYLRVHTSAGEELILMRLGDAIRELEGIEGLQTHRSWWVAREGLAETERVNGKLVLKLKSGAEAPVSRTYRKSIQNAGWL